MSRGGAGPLSRALGRTRRSMQQSVVRRSLLATAAFLAGNLFHLALMLTVNRLVEPAMFGRFFASMSLLDVLLVPATGLSFVLARHFAAVFLLGGVRVVAIEARRLAGGHLAPGAALALLVGLVLLLFGWSVGSEGLWLAAVVPLSALAIYLFQLLRTAFQGMLDFLWYNVSWIVHRAAQYGFALGGLLLGGAVWTGVLGIFVATALVSLLLLAVLWRRGAHAAPAAATAPVRPFRIGAAVPFMLEFGGFVLLANLDVLVAYVSLDSAELGAYAASAFLPKAVVVAVLPVTQVMLPMLTAAAGAAAPQRAALLKAVAVTGALAAGGAAVLWLGADVVCDQRFGVRYCAPSLIGTLALAAVPLTLLRLLIVARLALGLGVRLLLPFAVAAAGAAMMLSVAATPAGLAEIYVAACWAVPGTYLLAACLRGLRRRSLAPAR
jgi:O-antigen/teichoic acid export membrane protein